MYTGIRYKQSQLWQERVFPPTLYGGRKGKSAIQAELKPALQLQAKVWDSLEGSETAEVGASLDRKKCFDNSKAPLLIKLAEKLGLGTGFCGAHLKFYGEHKRAFKLGRAFGNPFHTESLFQGCAASLIYVNCGFSILNRASVAIVLKSRWPSWWMT